MAIWEVTGVRMLQRLGVGSWSLGRLPARCFPRGHGNVLNWLGIVVDSAIGGSKNGSSLPVGEKIVHRCLVAWRDYARECSELAWDCRGFCKCGCKNGSPLCLLVKKWFVAALWLGGTMQGNVLNWLGVVVDSAICGCKNGSSLPVGEKMVHRRLVAWRDYARECSELAWDCRGFCNMWLQKWFLSASG